MYIFPAPKLVYVQSRIYNPWYHCNDKSNKDEDKLALLAEHLQNALKSNTSRTKFMFLFVCLDTAVTF